MSIEALAPYLAGPGAGLLVCLLVGAGLYKLVVSKVLPLIEGAVSRHLKQIDDMSERHHIEHTAILESLAVIKEAVTTK
jgi:hypothetical protein